MATTRSAQELAEEVFYQAVPDCCEVWPKIAPLLKWRHTEDRPDIVLMPTLPGDWRVNFCPSCGADRRGVKMLAHRLVHPEHDPHCVLCGLAKMAEEKEGAKP